jgi:protein phosphatase
VRENNEDACLALPEEGLLMVADGMGGELAGEVASRLTCEWLPPLVGEHVTRTVERSDGDVAGAIRDAIVTLNHRLRLECSQMADVHKMGSTVTMALVRAPLTYVGHVGDSRAYAFDGEHLERLTQDHSVVGMLLERGAISREEAAAHPMRGHLSRYVGMGGEVRPDVLTLELNDRDWLLLCTDGLTDGVREQEVESILVRSANIHEACEALVGAARATGGRDNITVMVAERRAQA